MGEDTQLKAGGKERREAARLQNAAYGVQGAYREERQAVSRVRETEKESKAVRHNQAERRQYFAAGEAATAEQGNGKIKNQQTLTNIWNKH